MSREECKKDYLNYKEVCKIIRDSHSKTKIIKTPETLNEDELFKYLKNLEKTKNLIDSCSLLRKKQHKKCFKKTDYTHTHELLQITNESLMYLEEIKKITDILLKKNKTQYLLLEKIVDKEEEDTKKDIDNLKNYKDDLIKNVDKELIKNIQMLNKTMNGNYVGNKIYETIINTAKIDTNEKRNNVLKIKKILKRNSNRVF